MKIDISVIFFTVLNVLILFWFLRKMLFVPVTNFMNNRTDTIEKRINESKELLKQAELMRTEYGNRLVEAENEGKKIVQEFKDKAINLSNEITEQAKKEAELIRARALNDAEREKEKANDEIRRQIITLSLLAASKAVEGQLDNKNQHLLIKQFASRVGM
jgi:F-type H+-transporting ATPase subunit b